MIFYFSKIFSGWSDEFPLIEKELLHSYGKNFEIILTMFLSILKFNKNAHLVLIVDEGLPIPKEIFDGLPVEFVFYKRKTNYLVLERLIAYRNVLAMQLKPHYLFLDWDLLFQKDVSQIFDKNFDLFFTQRRTENLAKDFKDMPINVGVFGAKLKNYSIVLAFFNRWLQTLSKMEPGYQFWLGEQLALYELLKKGSPEGGKILILNEEYNYPVTYNQNYNLFIEGPSILHFKGISKKFLIPYWENYLKEL